MVKVENGVRPPETLGQFGKALKFSTKSFSKHLKTVDVHKSLLNTNDKKKIKSKIVKYRGDESMCSSVSSSINSEDNDDTDTVGK